MMHTHSGTSESKKNAGGEGASPRGRFVLGAAGLASVVGECMGSDSRAMRKAIAGAALLLCSVGSVVAQEAAWNDGADALAAAQPVSTPKAARDSAASVSANAPAAASDGIPVLHYSDDKHTNARLNAVFDLIATQGDGLVWDGAHHPVQPKPAAVLALAAPITKPLSASATFASMPTTSPASMSTAVASTPIAATAPIAAPAPAPQTWAFAPSGSLQDTLAAWAHEAGWKTPDWQASQPYKITSTQPLVGSFMDALRAVADAEPAIDIDVSTINHTLTIVDHKIM